MTADAVICALLAGQIVLLVYIISRLDRVIEIIQGSDTDSAVGFLRDDKGD